jgi:hypothetical protein
LKQSEIVFLIVSLILAAVVGGLVGDIIGKFLPEGAAKTLFLESLPIGIKSFTVDFFAISFTFGFMFKINFVSVLFLVMVVIYFRWWYI